MGQQGDVGADVAESLHGQRRPLEGAAGVIEDPFGEADEAPPGGRLPALGLRRLLAGDVGYRHDGQRPHEQHDGRDRDLDQREAPRISQQGAHASRVGRWAGEL